MTWTCRACTVAGNCFSTRHQNRINYSSYSMQHTTKIEYKKVRRAFNQQLELYQSLNQVTDHPTYLAMSFPSLVVISHSTPTGDKPASVARSTAASVCPPRSSTPPGWMQPSREQNTPERTADVSKSGSTLRYFATEKRYGTTVTLHTECYLLE